MIRAIICFKENDKLSCVKHLENITFRVRYLLLIVYENLKEFRASHSVVELRPGLPRLGVGKMVDGKFVKDNGLNSNYVLFFQALDAFLGMDRYLTDENILSSVCLHFHKYRLHLSSARQPTTIISHQANHPKPNRKRDCTVINRP